MRPGKYKFGVDLYHEHRVEKSRRTGTWRYGDSDVRRVAYPWLMNRDADCIIVRISRRARWHNM